MQEFYGKYERQSVHGEQHGFANFLTHHIRR